MYCVATCVSRLGTRGTVPRANTETEGVVGSVGEYDEHQSQDHDAMHAQARLREEGLLLISGAKKGCVFWFSKITYVVACSSAVSGGRCHRLKR